GQDRASARRLTNLPGIAARKSPAGGTLVGAAQRLWLAEWLPQGYTCPCRARWAAHDECIEPFWQPPRHMGEFDGEPDAVRRNRRGRNPARAHRGRRQGGDACLLSAAPARGLSLRAALRARSEERRVGKEWW